MASAAAVVSGRTDRRSPAVKSIAGGWVKVPVAFLSRLPFCLSPLAYTVMSQLVLKTRWGGEAKSIHQKRDWFSARQDTWAKDLGVGVPGLRKALDEAISAGVL